MADANLATAIVKARLENITSLTGGVHVGAAPKPIGTDSTGKWIKPYAIIWAGPGGDKPSERDATGLYDIGALAWEPQITVVGPDANQCTEAAGLVIAALANQHVGGGWLIPDSAHNTQLTPLLDDQVTPARYFLPLRFTLFTN